MSSNISFQEDESILFKHKSSHNNEQGELIVTNIRVCFVSTNNQLSPVQLPWQSIDKTKYTPMNDPKGRVMLMIQTVVKSGPIVFQLVGELQSCQRELERLKEIISKLRSTSSSSAPSLSAAVTTQTTTSSSQSQSVALKESSKQSISQSILTTRRNLLDADKQLAAKYRDLVINDKILTENDFWLAVEEKSGVTDEKGSTTYHDPTIRGKSTSLFADVKKTFKNGKLTVNLTTENKESIFLLYPAVKYAFTEEVPFHKTESEFWISYFQSEYYNRDKGGGMSTEGANMLVNRSRIDEVLSQYESLTTAAAATKQIKKDGDADDGGDCNIIHEKKRKLEGQVDPSIDLTSTFGDYRPSEAQSSLLPYEDKDSSSSSSSATTSDRHRLAVIEKYNKHSSVLMNQQQQPHSQASSVKKAKITTIDVDANEMEELQLHKPASSHYIQLHLSTTSATTTPSTSASTTATVKHQEQDGSGNNNIQQLTVTTVVEVEESAFGKSSFRKPTSQTIISSSAAAALLAVSTSATSVINHLPHSIDITTTITSNANNTTTNTTNISTTYNISSTSTTGTNTTTNPGMTEIKHIRDTISTAWPTSDRAKQTNQNIILASLREASLLQLVQSLQRPVLATVSSSMADSKTTSSSIHTADQDILLFKKNQASFIQEMLEKYGTVTELLRHFYAILSSPGLATTFSSATNNAVQRVEKLIQRLLQHKDQLLRKLEYLDGNIKDRQQKLACKAMIDDFLKLLDRAEGKWKDYRLAFNV